MVYSRNRRARRRRRRAGASLLLLFVAALLIAAATAAAAAPTFRNVKVVGKPGGGLPWTEPRIALGPDGRLWVVTNDTDSNGTAIALSSSDGGHSFQKAASPLAGQTSPTPDVDVVTMHTGRILGSELDSAGLNFPTSFTDDGGKTWTQSTGTTQLTDQDRQWFAVAPDDPTTHEPTVYLLFHNLASGNAQHNMFVARSTDGGASFGPPIPITLPGDEAYADLQCADSGGPSAIFVNQRNGTVYAEFTTRATPTAAADLGGCAPPATGQPFEFNIVAGTRVWLAQSSDRGQTWSNSLAVDDAATQQIVSMQVASGGLDTAGNVYVVYPESPLGKKYPDYSGAGVKYRFAAPAPTGKQLQWSVPRTLAPADASAPGHVLVHAAIGAPGQLMAAYWTGVARPGADPVWYMTAAETNDGFDAKPKIAETRISSVPTDTGTAGQLMGACHPEAGPVSGIINGVVCNRSPDVWGMTLDQSCMAHIVWPAVDNKATGNEPGTWVSSQIGGASLCSAVTPPAPGGRRPPIRVCPDRIPPISRFDARRTRISGRRPLLVGSSSDRGCASANTIHVAGRVARVYISLARIRTRGRHVDCRFLQRDGRLSKTRSCNAPILLRLRGKRHWRFAVRTPLPPGKYEVVVRAYDAARNKERPTKGRNILFFTVR